MAKSDKAKILKERAEKLALKKSDPLSKKESIGVIEFLLAEERYGIETTFIKEIYPLKEITFLPSVPPFVMGLINVRRRIISVIDLRKLFGLNTSQEAQGMGIILSRGEMEFGIYSEKILGLREIYEDDLQSSLPTLTGLKQEFLLGLTEDNLIILDGEKILTSSAVIVQETV